MKNIEQILLPGSIVALIHWIIWIIKYPEIVHDSLMFRGQDWILSVGTWIFLGLSTFATVSICKIVFL